jgi:hypothetical protein
MQTAQGEGRSSMWRAYQPAANDTRSLDRERFPSRLKLFHHPGPQAESGAMKITMHAPIYFSRLAWLCLAAALASCAPQAQRVPVPTGPSAADIAFESLSRRYFDEVLALTPVAATALGDHRYDDKLDDVGAAGRERRLALEREMLGAVQALEPAQLSRAHQVDARLLASQLEFDAWRIEELQDWRWDPLVYTNLAGNSVYTLLARDFAPLPERLRNARSRLSELPRLLAQVRESLDPARVPKIHAETAAKQNGGLLSLIDELVVPNSSALPEDEQAQLKSTIDKARKAVSQHQIWLDKRLVPEARGDFRIGATLYDRKLAFALDSPLSRQQIRERAERELASTRAQMYEIARTVLSGREGAPPTPDAPDGDTRQNAIVAALELATQSARRVEVFDAARRAYDSACLRAREDSPVYDDRSKSFMPEFQRGVALAYCDAGPLTRDRRRLPSRPFRTTGRTSRSNHSCVNTTRAPSTISPFTRQCRATTCSSRIPTVTTRRCAPPCSPARSSKDGRCTPSV